MKNPANITVGLLQMNPKWEDALSNRSFIEAQLSQFQGNLDLLVLPEMFSTGFTMNPIEVAETMNGETVDWMKTIAAEKNIAIAGSLVITENGKFYNRLIVTQPSGEISYYDKRHLFSLSGEDEIYTCGNVRKIVKVGSFRICLQICYDLRFPAFSRFNDDFDVLIYVANWPGSRISAWETLLKARAIENISYVVGVNRLGTDKNDLDYPGKSQIIDFEGNVATEANAEEGIFTVKLVQKNLNAFRENFGFLNDRDEITVK